MDNIEVTPDTAQVAKVVPDTNSLLKITPGRDCGECQACCFAPRLDELEKPSFTSCKNQGQGECTDYENRPTPCRDYNCMWRLGYGAKDDRPDKTGLMLTARMHANLGPWVSAHVVDEKARKSRSAQSALVNLCQTAVVIEFLPDSMVMVGGPANRVKAFRVLSEAEGVPIHEDLVQIRRPTK